MVRTTDPVVAKLWGPRPPRTNGVLVAEPPTTVQKRVFSPVPPNKVPVVAAPPKKRDPFIIHIQNDSSSDEEPEEDKRTDVAAGIKTTTTEPAPKLVNVSRGRCRRLTVLQFFFFFVSFVYRTRLPLPCESQSKDRVLFYQPRFACWTHRPVAWIACGAYFPQITDAIFFFPFNSLFNFSRAPTIET